MFLPFFFFLLPPPLYFLSLINEFKGASIGYSDQIILYTHTHTHTYTRIKIQKVGLPLWWH